MKKILEESKDDNYPVSNVKIIEDGEVNIARSNENNNKKLKVKFSYYTNHIFDPEKPDQSKPHILVTEYNEVWRNNKKIIKMNK